MPRFKNTSQVPVTLAHGQPVAPSEIVELEELADVDQHKLIQVPDQDTPLTTADTAAAAAEDDEPAPRRRRAPKKES